MTEYKSEFLSSLAARGFIAQCTDETGLDAAANDGMITGYIGYDCTAPSLHVGNLISILMLRRLQMAGHRPIVVIGGGTTKVGDPSGKDDSLSSRRAKMLSNPPPPRSPHKLSSECWSGSLATRVRVIRRAHRPARRYEHFWRQTRRIRLRWGRHPRADKARALLSGVTRVGRASSWLEFFFPRVHRS